MACHSSHPSAAGRSKTPQVRLARWDERDRVQRRREECPRTQKMTTKLDASLANQQSTCTLSREPGPWRTHPLHMTSFCHAEQALPQTRSGKACKCSAPTGFHRISAVSQGTTLPLPPTRSNSDWILSPSTEQHNELFPHVELCQSRQPWCGSFRGCATSQRWNCRRGRKAATSLVGRALPTGIMCPTRQMATSRMGDPAGGRARRASGRRLD